MIAEATKEVVKEPEVEPVPFVMPVVRAGQSVLWYPKGEKLPGNKYPPEIAFVLKSGQKVVRVRTASGYVHDSVPHIADPRLTLNEDIRASGAWDHIEEDKQLRADILSLQTRVTALEALLSEPAKKK